MSMVYVASFSGGKDSTAMVLELIDKKYPLDEVVFFDTGWEFPQMYRHVEKIKTIVEDAGIKFTTLHPKESFDYLLFDKPVKRRNGESQVGNLWCGYKGMRWGTNVKTRTIDNFFKNIPNRIQYVGIACDEPHRLSKDRSINMVFPLNEWGWTEKDCLDYCYNRGYDWEGLYEQLDRVSCRFCALKNLKELRNMYYNMPEVWAELKEYQTKVPRPFKGEGKSVPDLEVRFELEKEFEAQGKSIRNREFFNELKKRLDGVNA